MTFLSRLGKIIATVSEVFLGFAPFLTKAVPQSGGVVSTVSKDLADVGNIVAQVEAIGQLKGLAGPDRAKLAGPLVAQIIMSSTLLANKKIANPDLFNQGCVNISGGVADVLNSLHEDSVATVTAQVGK